MVVEKIVMEVPQLHTRELKRAIELNKPRWMLVHDHVVFARSLIKYLGYGGKTERNKLFESQFSP